MARKIILVADENFDTAQCVYAALAPAYEALHAPTYERACAALAKKSPALVFLSQTLPPETGLAFLAQNKIRRPNAPFILLAEQLESELVRSAFRCGASDVLQKPLQAEDAQACLQRVLPQALAPRPQGLQQAYSRIKKFFSPSSALAKNLETASTVLSPPGAVVETSLAEPANETPHLHEQTESLPSLTKTAAAPASPALRADEPECAAPRLCADFFGKFCVAVNDCVVSNWSCRKSKLLFADLLLNHNRRHGREVLMETFWPNAEASSARNSLNVALHHIRRALHEALPDYDFIRFKDECYFLNPEVEVWLDVEEFKRYCKRAQTLEREHGREAALAELEQAKEIYCGDFMEDELYDTWAASQREHFKEVHLVVLDRISKTYSLNGKPAQAVALCEDILARDNCREDVHRRLMLCYYRLDKRDKALKQFKKCEEILQAELEVKPTRATVELYEKIKTGAAMKKRRGLSDI